ncbi:hypothetical protein APY03_2960 [Variovorax sp. WDL1]|nr:hypothetical protein APY03_2960 [Variovorax sp. WDL1]
MFHHNVRLFNPRPALQRINQALNTTVFHVVNVWKNQGKIQAKLGWFGHLNSYITFKRPACDADPILGSKC